MATKYCRVRVPLHFVDSFVVIERLFRRVGAFLENPVTRKITTWEGCGEKKYISRESILEDVLGLNIQNVQFWYAEMEDFFVSWKKYERGGMEYTIYLDGLSSDYLKSLVSAVIDEIWVPFFGEFQDEPVFCVGYE